MKLFFRLFGYLLIFIIVLVGIDEYLSFRAEVKQFEIDMISSALQSGAGIAGIVASAWRESGEEKALQYIDAAARAGNIAIRWVWLDTLTLEYADSGREKEWLDGLSRSEPASFKMNGDDGELLRYTYLPVAVGTPRQGTLELVQKLTPLQEYKKRMMARAVVITALLSLIAGLILFFFIDRMIRAPLSRLMQQAQRIGRGDLNVDHSVHGNDELAEMGRIMNDICSRLTVAKEKIEFEYGARLQTLDQLRHSERLSTFGLIAAGIAHEIGTPLNVVDGRAKMIMHEGLNAEETKECAAIIINQAERITLIVRQLLDFTRRSKQHIAPENITLLVRQVFQLLQPMAGRQRVQFSLVRAENMEVELSVDGSQMQQVLINLLMNSVQAMPDGGKITVNLSNEDVSMEKSDESRTTRYMKIQIVDEGEGIRREDLEHIFMPFFTTKTIGTGTGLGLSIAHGIVEEHGGWIDVESSASHGACFTVFLPMREFDE